MQTVKENDLWVTMNANVKVSELGGLQLLIVTRFLELLRNNKENCKWVVCTSFTAIIIPHFGYRFMLGCHIPG